MPASSLMQRNPSLSEEAAATPRRDGSPMQIAQEERPTPTGALQCEQRDHAGIAAYLGGDERGAYSRVHRLDMITASRFT